MKFQIDKAIEVLQRTPSVIDSMLRDISDDWAKNNEGGDSWSPYDIVGHLVHGETTDWIARLEIILSEGGEKRFKPFDRFAQFSESRGKSLNQLIDEFKDIRQKNIATLRSKNLDETGMNKTAEHPAFGTVTLRQLLSTWVAHDLGHIAQIARVMAKQYKTEVGPWTEYMPILK